MKCEMYIHMYGFYKGYSGEEGERGIECEVV